MSPRNWKFRIEDIISSLDLIYEYMTGVDYNSWSADRKTIDAVIRNLEIIGEAANRIPDDIQKRYSDVPWAQMKGMRNILIHEYFGVDTDILWQTIQKDLPLVRDKIRQLPSKL